MQSMKGEVPVKVICPGKVYRRDDDDATHSFQFHQVEGLVISENIRMSDLKGTLLQFVREMFGAHTEIRLRPSFSRSPSQVRKWMSLAFNAAAAAAVSANKQAGSKFGRRYGSPESWRWADMIREIQWFRLWYGCRADCNAEVRH